VDTRRRVVADESDRILELARPLLAEALPGMAVEQAVVTALGGRIRVEVERIFAAGLRAADHAIGWNTTCLGCAERMDNLYDERCAGYREGRAAAAEKIRARKADYAGTTWDSLEQAARIAEGETDG
jgi:hypothetical protein